MNTYAVTLANGKIFTLKADSFPHDHPALNGRVTQLEIVHSN